MSLPIPVGDALAGVKMGSGCPPTPTCYLGFEPVHEPGAGAPT